MPNVASAVLLAATFFIPTAPASVSVAYAGSLVTVMERQVAGALLAREHIAFAGEAKGSKALANLIGAGLRNPDVFISADPALLDKLRTGSPRRLSRYVVFGSARMLLGFSPRSPHAATFEAAASGRASLMNLLRDPTLKIGRTDPQLDPKGARTLRVLRLLARHFHSPGAAAGFAAAESIYPEEDLLVRVESGELDGAFFYSTETSGKGLRVLELPSDANLSTQIAYGAAILLDAPHPAAAQRFMTFILHGEGRSILKRAGLRYFSTPRVVR